MRGSAAAVLEPEQPSFDFPIETRIDHSNRATSSRAGAFTDNMSLPVHRWFRYSAGFSAQWVEQLIEQHGLKSDDLVFDPFAGSGTTLLASQAKGIRSIGTDTHYFVRRVANAKLLWTAHLEKQLIDSTLLLIDDARKRLNCPKDNQNDLLEKCYSPETLAKLIAIRRAYEEGYAQQGALSELLWLVITSILRECSGVGTAQWQYVLPNKTKAKTREPFDALISRAKIFCSDMQTVKSRGSFADATIEATDARDLKNQGLEGKVKLIVTSPPYPNNYDYADATRLEMTFWGEVSGWGGLQNAVRRHLIRSCSQHSAAEKLNLDTLLANEEIAPIRPELSSVCKELADIRETKGGKKTYHTMIAAYFLDLARVWRALHPLCARGANAYFVIGDSAPYGVHVPAERWLGELAGAAGFSEWSFEKLRDRNIKWKNRKHRVPLKEGILRVRA